MAAVLVLLAGSPLPAASYTDAEQLYFAGEYEACIEIAGAEVRDGVWNDRWPRLLIECQLATGRNAEALDTYEAAVKKFGSRSLPLRLLGPKVLRLNDQPARARQEDAAILESVRLSPIRFTSSENLIALGRYFASRGEDARQVLELFYDRARNASPSNAEVYVATAELALEKTDFQVAADNLDKAAQLRGEDPYIFYLAARAWESSNPVKATEFLQQALSLNPRHVPSLVLQAENLMDSESYDEAAGVLRSALLVNLHEPRVWALLAAIAHLQGRYRNEQILRAAALDSWKTNPEVDHEIGRHLSRHYRFAEGARYQQSAIRMDPQHEEARFALAQDLLRLGREGQGWPMAQQVADEDPYNVVAHNLAQLHDRITAFTTLQRGNLVVRMDSHEAGLYGKRALDVLDEARDVLLEKYSVEIGPEQTIAVEIFPRQQDFAIRTFGLPGGDGFLGVCFGRVITMVSPATLMENPQNWEAVLWHEFCHAVTLEKTRNRMPRWLSEGISVYEERQRDASWGQPITPLYREMLLGDAFLPLSELSSGFLRPASPMHLQFAYFESALAVEFLAESFGQQTLNRILDSLAAGLSINESLSRYAGDLEGLDERFKKFAQNRARQFGPEAEWDRKAAEDGKAADLLALLNKAGESRSAGPTVDVNEETTTEEEAYGEEEGDGGNGGGDAVDNATADEKGDERDEAAETNPERNYWMQLSTARELLQSRNTDEAIKRLEALAELVPNDVAPGGILRTLAAAYEQAGRVEDERETLHRVVDSASDVFAQLNRLIEIEREQENWGEVARLAKDVLAMNPLVPTGYEALSEASENLGRYDDLARSLDALLQLEPVDPAGLRYRLASAYEQLEKPDLAQRHVLMALEDAPRYREALGLLLRVTAPPQPEETVEEAAVAEEPANAVVEEVEEETDAASATR